VTAKPADRPKRAGEIQTIKHTSGGTGPQLTRQKAACAAWCPFALFRDGKAVSGGFAPSKTKTGGGGVSEFREKRKKAPAAEKSRVCQWRALIGQILRLKNSNERKWVKVYKKRTETLAETARGKPAKPQLLSLKIRAVFAIIMAGEREWNTFHYMK